jgi:hypothetical protein
MMAMMFPPSPPPTTTTMTQSSLPVVTSTGSCCTDTDTATTLRILSQERLEELRDILGIMKRQENNYKRPRDYSNNTRDNDPWRPIMISWMFSVTDIFQLAPMIPSTAIYYLDTVCDTLVKTPSDYQLVGLTALQLAIKVHETKLFPLQQLVQMGNGGMTVEQVMDMERQVLETCQWKLHPPTPECFLLAYNELLLLPSTSTTQEEPQPLQLQTPIMAAALLYIRQALLQEKDFEPSVLAYASMLVAMEQQVTPAPLPLSVKQAFGTNMLQVSGLSAATPGLSRAYEWLSPKPEQPPVFYKPPVMIQPPPQAAPVITPQEVIYCAEDGNGFEVTWLEETTQKDYLDLELSASFSPRNVAI